MWENCVCNNKSLDNEPARALVVCSSANSISKSQPPKGRLALVHWTWSRQLLLLLRYAAPVHLR